MNETLSPGRVFAGRYRILRPLKSGGMGTVYEADHVATHQRVALKTMRPEIVASPQLQTRFAQEARVSGIIQSRHVVGVTDAGVEEGIPFLVMEYLRGKELGDVLLSHNVLPLGAAVAILQQLAKGLDKAHAAGVVHRDLKPENIFLTRDEDGELLVKILDFGIAKLLQGVSSTTSAGGTPTYMAPEQTRKGNLTPAVDVWAFGLIAFRILSGRTFWDSDTIGELYGEILAPQYPKASQRSPVQLPAGFDEFFAQCVAQDPAARFSSASAAMKAFAEIAGPPESTLGDLALMLIGPQTVTERGGGVVSASTELAPSGASGGTVAAAPIEARSGTAIATQLTAASPHRPSHGSVRPPSARPKKGSNVPLVAGIALAGAVAVGVFLLTRSPKDQASASGDRTSDANETSSKPTTTTTAPSAKPDPIASATAPPTASGSSKAVASAAPPTGLFPSDAEYDRMDREVGVLNSSKLHCETKAVREWLRIRCSGPNDAGGTPTAVTIVRGASAQTNYAAGGDGETLLYLKFEEGVDVEASFSWTDKTVAMKSQWLRGTPRPRFYGVFDLPGGASPSAPSPGAAPPPPTGVKPPPPPNGADPYD